MTKKTHEIRYFYLQLEFCIEILMYYVFLHIDMSIIVLRKYLFVLKVKSEF